MGKRFMAKTCKVEKVHKNVAVLEKEGKSSFLANIHYNMDTGFIDEGDTAIVQFPRDNSKAPVIFGIMKHKVKA